MTRGLILCVIHVMLALTVAGKYVIDRATLPRAWARTAPIDPMSPLRGRYVRIGLEVEPSQPLSPDSGYVSLAVREGRLVASPADSGLSVIHSADNRWRLAQPLAFFIPDGAADPSIRKPGEELWVEVSVPKQGPPRPVRLGVKRDGVLSPLDLR